MPGVLATALRKRVAIDFIMKADHDHPRILWVVKVDGRGIKRPEHRVMHASFVHKSLIHDPSTYKPTESEYLYAAYSTFEVEAVRWARPDPATGKYKIGVFHKVLVRAANDNRDSKRWPEDLPLAPWY